MQTRLSIDFVDGVGWDALELLFSTPWPMHFDFVHRCRRAEAETEPRISVGVIAAPDNHFVDLPLLFRLRQLHARLLGRSRFRARRMSICIHLWPTRTYIQFHVPPPAQGV